MFAVPPLVLWLATPPGERNGALRYPWRGGGTSAGRPGAEVEGHFEPCWLRAKFRPDGWYACRCREDTTQSWGDCAGEDLPTNRAAADTASDCNDEHICDLIACLIIMPTSAFVARLSYSDLALADYFGTEVWSVRLRRLMVGVREE